MQLETQLNPRDITIQLTEPAYDLISKKGYSDTMGARPIGRIITNEIKKPLADEIIHGRLKNGGFVTVQTSEINLRLKLIQKFG